MGLFTRHNHRVEHDKQARYFGAGEDAKTGSPTRSRARKTSDAIAAHTATSRRDRSRSGSGAGSDGRARSTGRNDKENDGDGSKRGSRWRSKSRSKSKSRRGGDFAGADADEDNKDAATKAREGHDGETIPNNLDPARKPVNRQLQSRDAFVLNSLAYGLKVPTARSSTWDRTATKEQKAFQDWLLETYGSHLRQQPRSGAKEERRVEREKERQHGDLTAGATHAATKEGLESRAQDRGDVIVSASVHFGGISEHDVDRSKLQGKQYSGLGIGEAPRDDAAADNEHGADDHERSRQQSSGGDRPESHDYGFNESRTHTLRHRLPHLKRRTTWGVNNDLTSHVQELHLLPDPQRRRQAAQEGKDGGADNVHGPRAHHRLPFVHRKSTAPSSSGGADDANRRTQPQQYANDDYNRQDSSHAAPHAKPSDADTRRAAQSTTEHGGDPSRRKQELATFDTAGPGGRDVQKAMQSNATSGDKEGKGDSGQATETGYLDRADMPRPDLGKPRGADPEEPAHRYETHDPTPSDRIKGAKDTIQGKIRMDQDIVSRGKAEFHGQTSDR